MSPQLYGTYLLACLVVTLIPGPTVTLIVANSLRHGTKAGLLNVVGTQCGLAVILCAVALGLASLVGAMGWMFGALRLAGAAYLIWLGWKLLHSPAALDHGAPPPRGGFLLQGLMVMLANPKALLFFGAFIPQFIDPHGDYLRQVTLLGATAMATALLTDGAYAILAGRLQGLWSERRRLVINRTGGVCLIGGGLWLALQRSR